MFWYRVRIPRPELMLIVALVVLVTQREAMSILASPTTINLTTPGDANDAAFGPGAVFSPGWCQTNISVCQPDERNYTFSLPLTLDASQVDSAILHLGRVGIFVHIPGPGGQAHTNLPPTTCTAAMGASAFALRVNGTLVPNLGGVLIRHTPPGGPGGITQPAPYDIDVTTVVRADLGSAPGANSFVITFTFDSPCNQALFLYDQPTIDLTYEVNQPPNANAGGPYSGSEGSAIALAGTVMDPENGSLNTSWSYTPIAASGTCAFSAPAALSTTITCTDNGSYKVTLTVSDGTHTVTSDATLNVANVAPAVTAITGPASVLTGVPATFAGTATDASSVDQAAGFTWQWKVNGSVVPGTTSSLSHTFASCGTTYTISATATDKDGGTSAPFTLATPVAAYEARFLAPLDEGEQNIVQKGRVLPVKVRVGCGSTNLSGLMPAIQLFQGDISPANESGAVEVPTESVSAADTTGIMRPSDGIYIYNLRVPSDAAAVSGALYTIRVRPFGNSNPAASIFIVLRIK